MRCPTCGGAAWALVSILAAYLALLVIYLVAHGDLAYAPLGGLVVGWLPLRAELA